MKKYFVESWNREYLIRIEEKDKKIESIERYDFNKKQWLEDYKAGKLFGKMCIGSIDVDVISEEEAKKLTNE